MLFKLSAAMAVSASAFTCIPAQASVETANASAEQTVQVGGRHLRLNGAGVGTRLLFKVYAMGLYLPDRRETVQDILKQDEPRRMVIKMLRNVDSASFSEVLMEYVREDGAELKPHVIGSMLYLARLISEQPQGLRTGDTLTLDWIPGTGTVIELNKRAVSEPMRGADFYTALLNIWLGEKPADPLLKTHLLGNAQGYMLRTSK